MQLDPDAFNSFLNGIGQSMSWRRAFACPCLNPHSGSPNPVCPSCKGKGRTWAVAVTGMSGIAGMKVQREWAQYGLWESGDVVLTIPSDSPLYAMGPFDRVVFTDASEPFSISMTRGDNDVLRFPVVAIDRVFWLNGSGAIVEGGIPTVSTAGVLAWATGEPAAGTQYSITGRQRPEYFMFQEMPSDRAFHSGAALPRRVALRKYDVYGK